MPTPGQTATLQCLDNRVQVQSGVGALPAQTLLACRPVDPASLPDTPGELVADTAFEVTLAPGNAATLPATLSLLVTYPADAVTPAEASRLVVGYLDGDTWTELQEQAIQADQHRVSANINRPGVYALYLRP